jgi:sterol carrier protein 2
VIELHDCFTPNEVITYEGLELCPEGEAEKLVNNQNNTYSGKFVVNPSGGWLEQTEMLERTSKRECLFNCLL